LGDTVAIAWLDEVRVKGKTAPIRPGVLSAW